jgi:Ca-activated chloride channel homolog
MKIVTSSVPAAATALNGRRIHKLLAGPALMLSALMIVSGCVPKSDSGGVDASGVPNNAVVIDASVSSDKIDLMKELARTFNEDKTLSTITDTAGKKKRVFVRLKKQASGAAAQLLADGWDEAVDGPKPTLWSPASAAWGAILNQRLSANGSPAMTVKNPPKFMLTPLVIAMPKPMADVLGYPTKPVGYADLLTLAKDPQGWAAKGHPEWGTFKLGKTNPNFSTSGLSATIAQFYAATAKRSNLTTEDLAKPEVQQFGKDVENSVVHYGDITMTFLNNWFRADARGTSLTYASAVAVEEKSVIDYNAGNPDGILDAGEVPRKPRVPLVAIYPTEGTLFSDHPLFILNADWVNADQKVGAKLFSDYTQLPDNQRKVLTFGFRPGNPAVAVAAPIVRANGVNPNEPKTALEVPEPKVLIDLLDLWGKQRKAARVLLVIDVSGSMGDVASATSDGETKLDLAKRAAVTALDQFKGEDLVGLRVFTNDIGPNNAFYLDLIPVSPMSEVKEKMQSAIQDLIPQNGTPLYDIAQKSLDDMRAEVDQTRINAVVLLTDGRNDDGETSDDDSQLTNLIRSGRSGSEGKITSSVRIFPIAYGADADLSILKRMAEATNATAYDATDPLTIQKVFTNVISNF